MRILSLLLTTVFASVGASNVLHQVVTGHETESFVWEVQDLKPFQELIVSWEASRPESGHFAIDTSLFVETWSSWMPYAEWSANDQRTFGPHVEIPVRSYQDAVAVSGGQEATGFRIRVSPMEGASLDGFRMLHACTTPAGHEVRLEGRIAESVNLDVQGLSQLALSDERRTRLCSPTSTTAVLRYVLKSKDLSVLTFANAVWDSGFDIYGNWILNTAEAANQLGSCHHCWVARLDSFEDILGSLRSGFPVVVSVRGPLKGSALPYESGHLLVIKGFDADRQEVLCMDPAFPEDELTSVAYPLDGFIQAWNRRGGIAYFFQR